MSKIYRVQSLSDGVCALKASRTSLEDALREARFLLGSGASMVWIEDRDGATILAADEVRARVARLDAASRGEGSRTATTPSAAANPGGQIIGGDADA